LAEAKKRADDWTTLHAAEGAIATQKAARTGG
jgi:hypothetical protein